MAKDRDQSKALRVTEPPSGSVDAQVQFDEADLTVVVDAARATLGPDGTPEIHLAQLGRYGSSAEIQRLVVVSYDVQRFVDRATRNEEFRRDLEEWVESHAPPSINRLSSHLEGSKARADVSLFLEAESELMFRTGTRGAVLFLATSAAARHFAVEGKLQRLPMTVPLEAKMSIATLADMLDCWKSLADEVNHAIRRE